MRLLAELLEAAASETPAGGRSVSYEPVGWVWIKPGARRRRERDEPGGSRVIETLIAEARRDPRLNLGRVLRVSGGDWRLATVADGEDAGRVKLTLERDR